MLFRPTEYEYDVLIDEGHYAEAAKVARIFCERIEERLAIWKDKLDDAEIKEALVNKQ